MEFLKEPGEYIVEIRNPQWESCGKDGEVKMALALPGYCEIDGVEYTITGHIYFTPSLIQSGANVGKSMWEMNADICERLGMPKPFNPIDYEKLHGVKAKFVCEIDTFNNKEYLKVKYVNTVGKEPLPMVQVIKIWETLKAFGGAATVSEEFGGDELDMGIEDEVLPF